MNQLERSTIDAKDFFGDLGFHAIREVATVI